MLTREQIIAALERLGELAQEQGQTVELLVVGSVALMLGGYEARVSTRDVDAIIRELRARYAFLETFAKLFGGSDAPP